jgi:uncharacterized RDD family membrane protein YckC
MISYNFTFHTTKVLFRKRLLAQIIDCILVLLTVFVLTVFIKPIGFIFSWTLLWTYLIYAILMDAYREGTVGKMYMDLRIVRHKDHSSTLVTSFYRNFAKLFIALLVYGCWLLIYRNGYSGLHNKIAKTGVIEIDKQ